MTSYVEKGKRWYRVKLNGVDHDFANRTWAWRAVKETDRWGAHRARRATRVF